MSAFNQEDVDCRKIWESIELDTQNLLKKDLSNTIKDDLKININSRVEQMHKDLDTLGENFINQILDSFYNKNETSDTTKAENKITKVDKVELEKQQKIQDIMKIENPTERNYQLKMEELKNSVEDMINKTFVVDHSSEIFKNLTLPELLSISKDGFRFKIPRKISCLLKGKSSFDLKWDPSNNKSYSTINKDDESSLKIHGTTCYTYYKTKPNNIKDENFSVEIEYKISSYDDYFYLGIINDKVRTNNNCMCCTIRDAFYIQPSGDVILNGTRKRENKLVATKNKVHNLTMRFLITEKEMYIQMDENEEVGPYKITGNSFTFVSGSCNSVNGYVKILDAYYE